ncbi:MAG: hydroxymethylpyrimidine/phosphomethylpyrimidine kinase [Muribaculaceae bacterium]|nr:hydroxymethylpyrimidine/phosphomethylpyrimidine kinase [Muribaculaceae bacterium]
MHKKLKTLLSIAGSDPMGGAGIQADIRAGQAMGFHVVTAVTSVTVQNSKGIYDILPIDSSLLQAQLHRILEDCQPDAIKVGMMGSVNNFIEVGNFLLNLPIKSPVVVDPVLSVTADGGHLFCGTSPSEIAQLYLYNIFPWTSVATPNIHELKVLLNKKRLNLASFTTILKELSLNHLIVKGGDAKGKIITDKLLSYTGVCSHSHPKINCKNLHGTGCVYSSLLACNLALGFSLEEAFMITNKKMEEIINSSCDYSLGNSNYGPLNLIKYDHFD